MNFVPTKTSSGGEKYQDPIYGQITLEPYQSKIISTPHFHRLHSLKQMGSTRLVFTNANHTRFSHCVGVAYLARKMYRHLAGSDYSQLEEMLVVTAAMCHDLGHGPHSHAFEAWNAKSLDFNHEKMSVELVRDAFKNDYFDFLATETLPNRTEKPVNIKPLVKKRNIELIEAMIVGVDRETAEKLLPREKYWLLEIVHNKTHGIDVDKMDYLIRDMRAVYGTSNSHVQIQSIIDSTRVVNGTIRFEVSICNQLYELLYLRASMHRNVYTHEQVIAVKHMYLDLLDAINKNSKNAIENACHSASTFLLLSDSVFDTWNAMYSTYGNGVVSLLHRIHTRKFYTMIASFVTVNSTKIDLERWLEDYREKNCKTEADRNLFTTQNLFVAKNRFDMGNGEKNPLHKPIFYKLLQNEKVVECTADNSSCSLFYTHQNDNLCEYIVRLYCKRQIHTIDEQKLKQLCDSFSAFHKKI